MIKKLELICAEEILYNRTYYTVLPLVYGFRLHPSHELWVSMKEWCAKKFDNLTQWPDMYSPLREVWYCIDYKFWFRNQGDRKIFIEKFQFYN